ncbi:MAG: trypsin-like peptidase domain-containing protein [Syntrophomonadaceae bacterium]|nr:trypsin-like peptidase domain-containing protein [Syntrophomonadaceae bacterium]
MNREEMPEDIYEGKGKPGCWLKLTAVLLLVAFTLLALPGLSYLFTDRLRFLDQNQVLQEDQIVLQCKPAIVSIAAVSMNDAFLRAVHRGTGFNIAPTGTIITNRHVVENAGKITITFDDGTRFYVNQYETVPGNDIAVIHLKGHDLPTIALDPDDNIKSGDMVTVIGNPLGFENIAQRGEVDGRFTVADSTAPVWAVKLEANPGSSGSPLINSQSRVVGIVFAAAAFESNNQTESRALAIPVQVLPDSLF